MGGKLEVSSAGVFGMWDGTRSSLRWLVKRGTGWLDVSAEVISCETGKEEMLNCYLYISKLTPALRGGRQLTPLEAIAMRSVQTQECNHR